ncbi:MAG TPA: FHA domain-containing protein [Vicinamibacteria bacterium]
MAALRLFPASGAAAVEVSNDSTLVGRDATCDIVVSDGSVSRKHARLERRGDTWTVVDQGSANGTFVDSQRIVESPLQSGQELRFGAISYRVEIEGADDDMGATVVTSAMSEATVIQSEPLVPRPPVAHPPAPGTGPPPLPPRPGSPPPPPPRMGGGPPGPPPLPGGYAAASPVPPMAAPPLTPKKGRSPVFWIGLGCCGCLALVLVFIGLVGGFAVFATRGVVEAVRAQITEIKAGNMDAAYKRMSDAYRQSHTEADFGAFVARHPGLKENSDSTFTTRNVVNDKAHLEGYLMAASGAKETVTYELVKAGEWKIDDIKFEGESAATAQAGGSGGGGPGDAVQIETLDIQKEPAGTGTRVNIKVRVTGFAVKPDGDAYRMDLTEDLETVGPDGQRLPALSRMGLKTLRERWPQATGATAEFANTLSFINSPAPGSYTARLTIRDDVGQSIKTHEVRFDLP